LYNKLQRKNLNHTRIHFMQSKNLEYKLPSVLYQFMIQGFLRIIFYNSQSFRTRKLLGQ